MLLAVLTGSLTELMISYFPFTPFGLSALLLPVIPGLELEPVTEKLFESSSASPWHSHTVHLSGLISLQLRECNTLRYMFVSLAFVSH